MNTNIKFASLAVIVGGLILSAASPSLAFNNCNDRRFDNRHPRRAEVLNRDNHLNRMVTGDRGHLSGHYGQLKREDFAIRAQEQRDARMNGGHITRGEQARLNSEENRLRNQVQRDR